MGTETERRILESLERLEKEVKNIKEHMVDADTILTLDEKKLLNESYNNEKKGRLTSFEDLKNVRSKNR